MNKKRNPSDETDAEKSGSSGIPPEAEQEIFDRLFRQMSVSSDEMAEILERHGVCGDPDALQKNYRKRVAQRLMAGFRDSEGKREVLAGKGGEYYFVPLCNDLDALNDIEQRLQHQAAGVNGSSKMVTKRIGVLRNILDGLKGVRRKKKTDSKK